MESLFAMLKKKLIYRISPYCLSMAVINSLVFRNVFVYYNRIRFYTVNLDNQPPESLEESVSQAGGVSSCPSGKRITRCRG